MHTLVAFATGWGSKFGGINSFNTDFLSAFGVAYHHSVQVICIVASATPEEIEDAHNTHVWLVPLPYPPQDKVLSEEHAQVGISELHRLSITFNPDKTLWLGHDRFSGAAAIEAAKKAGGRSALIHHMSYDHYESYAANSSAAREKTQAQKTLFKKADLVLAVGPLLRNALSDLLGESKQIPMLIPGLAEIEPRSAPQTFTAFLSGRLSDNAARIKQGHLGIAAFAKAHREAREQDMPDSLCKQPKLVLRGVDFEAQQTSSPLMPEVNPETALKKFAEGYANSVINLQVLPYTQDRQELYDDLRAASVALMPSWHEGFGLVAWEAIAAGVPLIISESSGVFCLLDEKHTGAGTGCIYPINVLGSVDSPFFRPEDLQAVVTQLKTIAKDPGKARERASRLRELLQNYTWSACAEQAAKAFDWPLQKGSIPEVTSEEVTTSLNASIPHTESTSPLQMPLKRWQIGRGMADSQLLRAEEALVPFDPARQPELDALNAWLDDPQWPQSVRLLTGAGGTGKTRLAIELCQQRLAAGWHAGFLDADLDAKDMSTTWQTLGNLNQSLLIVIDYAETRQAVLLALIEAMLQTPGSQPVRILLLARDGGEWWENLPSKNPHCEMLLGGYATSGPFYLLPLYAEEEDRHRAYQLALNTFAQALEVDAPGGIPKLEGEHFNRPLYLQMAALLALHGERPTTAEGLTRALLNHERRYWRGLLADFGWAEPEREAQQLLALTTLAGGFATHRDARTYWDTASGSDLSRPDFQALFHALVPLYPGKQGLQAVRPDLLGEALVSQALLRPEADKLLDAVLANSASQPIHSYALTVLARISSQRPDLQQTLVEALVRHFPHCYQSIVEVAKETTGHLPELAEIAFERLQTAAKSQVAGLLKQRMEEESVQLAELDYLVMKYLEDKSRQKLSKKASSIDMVAYAKDLGNFAIALSRTGRVEKAVSCALEGLKRFESIYIKNRQLFEPDYAMSLNNYAGHLGEVGKSEEALEQAEQALEIHQRLAQKSPERFEPDYAMSLSNYANHLSKVGKSEEALEQAEQALEIHQRLAQKSPDRFEPDYATSLSNYAGHLSEVGKSEEALEYDEQAIKIRQRLIQKSPDRFGPDYATSLSNYAGHLSEVGKSEDALEQAEQALEIRQRLAQKSPERFEPDYAMSLGNYANHLSEVGKSKEALEHDEKAIKIRQRLTQKSPDRFEPEYAMSLGNYANHLREVDQFGKALKETQEALKIHQRLAQKSPDRFEPDHATLLGNYANYLREGGQIEEALEQTEQALEIHKRLTQKNPDRFEPGYAMTLNNYAICLSEVDRSEEALEQAQQALGIYKRLAQKRPARFTEALFNSNYSVHFQRWLNNPSDLESELTDMITMPMAIPPHRQPLLLLFATFVQACGAIDQSTRAQAFNQVLSIWESLSPADRTQAQSYWLCAAAWCAEFAPEAVAELDWQTNWAKYSNQRQGRLPHWMEVVARRLAFQWPA
jgi:tetratricopeptide (TPR) repeat protein/glycosyltransferase involved in cell wall biosynthesis